MRVHRRVNCTQCRKPMVTSKQAKQRARGKLAIDPASILICDGCQRCYHEGCAEKAGLDVEAGDHCCRPARLRRWAGCGAALCWAGWGGWARAGTGGAWARQGAQRTVMQAAAWQRAWANMCLGCCR
jgi:hypothetical protein